MRLLPLAADRSFVTGRLLFGSNDTGSGACIDEGHVPYEITKKQQREG